LFQVFVYFTGSLKQNNKVIDKHNSGEPFSFRLGRGHMIKGWEMGMTGMKVGGKRRLTIPAHLAYGGKGNFPAVPPNSTLVYVIDLLSVE